jgi:hypothetical protein
VDDEEGIARAIGDLLRSPDARTALGNAARARVLPLYGAHRLVADVDALYTRLMQPHRRS